MNKPNKRITNIIIAAVAVIVLLAVCVISFLPNRIATNSEDTVGNTAGNLNNNGLFCENDGMIYFANAYADGALYRMDANAQNVTRISDAKVQFLCAGGKYLYYYQTGSAGSSGLGSVRSMSGLYRAPKKGGTATCLDNAPLAAMNLVGNYIYYQHYDVKTNTTSYRIKIDKTEKGKFADNLINPACADNGTIYYNGIEKDHYLYAYNTVSNTTDLLWDYDIWNPIYQNGYIFYMDVHNNYALCRYDMNTQETVTLSQDRIDYFNVLDGVIFYQVSSETAPALMRMNADGSNVELIAEGIYENINLTSQYAFFSEYGSPVPVYMTSTTGPAQVTTFDAARDAAMKDTN
ncbi:MAG: DUF5050 domain-containing protein [Lachnospiraceae bacterium]|nr:DUF5050 domain-containing protein [Lachnospiraceae bacterium]